MKKKTATLVGIARDAILALFVTRNTIRDFDKSVEVKRRDDKSHIGIEIKDRVVEEQKEEFKGRSDDKEYYVCCIDESEHLNIFSHKTTANAGRGGFHMKIRDC